MSLCKSERRSLKSDSSESKKTTKSFHRETKELYESEHHGVIHKSNTTHNTDSCYTFKSLNKERKLESLRKVQRSFRCFANHFRNDYMLNDACELCSSTEHHVLLCNKSTNKSNCCSSTGESNASRSSASKRSNSVTSAYIGPTETNVANGSMSTIYPKTEVQATDRHYRAMVFYDGRSNSTYVTQAAVCRLHARKIGSVMLVVKP